MQVYFVRRVNGMADTISAWLVVVGVCAIGGAAGIEVVRLIAALLR
jgi:hypothetical protein